jgi:hypothetical protein
MQSKPPQPDPEIEPHITKCTKIIYVAIHDIQWHTYTDLTGRFPTVSSRGYTYILVLYDFDTNNLLAEQMKSKSDAEAIRSYTVIYNELTIKGLTPLFQTMDN